MRYICSVIICMWLFPAHAVTSWDYKKPRETITLDFLFEVCAKDMGDPNGIGGIVPFFDCDSYIYGVLDSYLLIRDYIPKKERVCLPVDISPWKVLEDTKNIFYTDKGRFKVPYNGTNSASEEIIKELHKKYPCE